MHTPIILLVLILDIINIGIIFYLKIFPRVGSATITAPTTTSTISSPTPTTTSVRLTVPCPVKEIYGEDSEEVEILRYFRDNVLSRTPEAKN